MRTILIIIIFYLTISLNTKCQNTDKDFIAEVYTGLEKLLNFQHSVKDIHPFLKDLQAVAVINKDKLYIFDVGTDSIYSFIKTIPVPFPMNENIRASFPLMEYDMKPVCVTGKDAFKSTSGLAVILHEFIHCSQYKTIEPEIKNQLEINRIALEKQDYSWEITHPFVYDSLFLKNYELFHKALLSNDSVNAVKYRKITKDNLSSTDFEYLTWQEWKEGFARFIENEIRRRAGIEENNGGNNYQQDRIIFYYGGSLFIRYLLTHDEKLKYDLKLLFKKITEF
jgi:mRNA-degrading endonuclease HigB of HigAB toxin-antitoxin module